MSYVVRRSELAHWGKSPPMSIHGSWPSFVSRVVAFVVICGWQSSFVGGRLHFLASHGGSAVMGCGWHWVSCRGCCWWHCWVVVVVG